MQHSEGTPAARVVWLGARRIAGLGISLAEGLAVAVGFLLLWAVLARVAGGPLYSDDLGYIQIGLNDTLNVRVLNRYFHIFLQKLFMELAPSPIVGVRVYWGFLVALTAAVVYVLARSLSAESHPLHGALALGIFFSCRVIAEYSGITVVDITAMAMAAALVLAYHIATREGANRHWPLYVMGALFFLALKTKETTAVFGLLFLGLGFDENDRFAMARLARRIARVGVGVAAGILLFILLNAVVLGEPLFGLRLQDLAAFSSAVAVAKGLNRGAADWYSGYLLPHLPVVFLLYLLSGLQVGARLTRPVRLLWIVPLVLIAFLTLSMIRGDWGIRPRHLFPILPLLSLAAPQFLRFGRPAGWRGWAGLAGATGLSVLGVLLVRFLSQRLLERLSGDFSAFLPSVLFPMAFSALLALILLVPRYSMRTVAVPLFLLGLTLYAPLYASIKDLLVVRSVASRYQQRVYALEVFGDRIAYHEGMRMLVSARAAKSMLNSTGNSDTMLSLFNLLFDANSTRANFTHLDFEEARLEQVLAPGYDYILLTAEDWQALTEPPGARAALEGAYEVLDEPHQEFYLLVLR